MLCGFLGKAYARLIFLAVVDIFCLPIFPAYAQADITYTLGSAAGTVQPLLGVNAGPLHWTKTATMDVTAGFRLIGVRSVRTHDFTGAVDMAVMYPDRSKDPTLQSSYNFSSTTATNDYSSDTAIATLKDNGIGVYLRIWDSAQGTTTPTYNPTAAQRANWVKAAVEVVRHYQEGKWNGYSNLITYIEIGNEPDSQYFWSSSYTKEEFYALYSDTALALRAAFPTLKIGGPGITGSGYVTTSGKQWIGSFLDYIKGTGAPLDFLSWHTYTSTPSDITTGANYFQTQLNSRGFTNTEQHVTEYHTFITSSTDATQNSANQQTRTMSKGAALLTAIWINMQQAGIKQAFVYRANDPNTTDPQRYGLFATDGSARRTALAFGFWSEFAAYAGRIDPSASATIGGLKALAASRDDGRIAVLVANTDSASHKWTLGFSDTRSLSDYFLELKTIDDSHSTATPNVPTSTTIEIAANTVQLLTLLPRRYTLNVVTGWNLLGNSTASPITVASIFNDTSKVASVWKWNSGTSSSWAFYSPSLSDGGQSFASSRGYAFLTTINAGEGFWVNAITNFSQALSGSAVTTMSFKDGSGSNAANILPSGWSLIAVGDGSSPRAFANGIASTAPGTTSVAATSLTSLWTWYADPAGKASGWYFYAPSLDNDSGLSSFISGKNYLDFTGSKTLDASTGFWVYHP